MSTIEDRLHSAIRETAAEIPSGSVPPLALPSPGQRGRPRQVSLGRRHPGWRRAVAPLAAAASVIAVIAAVLTLTGPGGSRGQAPSTGGPSAQDALASVPRYYVALTGYTGALSAHTHAEVRTTATGKVLATVSPPRPYRTFSWVSGAADDRTFALAAQPREQGASAEQNAAQRTQFFLLHFSAATGTAALTALPITEKRGYQAVGVALSPDGSKLAVALAGPQDSGQAQGIQVFTVATGAGHDWTWTGPGYLGSGDSSGQPLSWAADSRTLAFQQWKGNQLSVRLLDTAAGGSSLRSARQAVSIPTSILDHSNSLLTPDGRTVIYAEAPGNLNPRRMKVKLRLAEFSARTGKLLRAVDPWWFNVPFGSVPYQQVLWASSGGRTLIVISPPGTSPAGHWVRHRVQPAIGVFTGNHFTPIPGSLAADQNIESIAW